mgnify:CR=1 FL=1
MQLKLPKKIEISSFTFKVTYSKGEEGGSLDFEPINVTIFSKAIQQFIK